MLSVFRPNAMHLNSKPTVGIVGGLHQAIVLVHNLPGLYSNNTHRTNMVGHCRFKVDGYKIFHRSYENLIPR